MPELVAEPVGRARVGFLEDLAVLVEIGDVEDLPMLHARVVHGLAVAILLRRRLLERTIETGKRDLLRIVDTLIRQDAHGVAIHRLFDRAFGGVVERLGEIGASESCAEDGR